MKLYKKLPQGAYKAMVEAEAYVLKSRKRFMYESNRNLHMGLRYLVWSRYAKGFWERTVTEITDPVDIGYYLLRGWIWWWPTEENKDTIKSDVHKSGLGYRDLMTRRQAEIDKERNELYGNRGNGWQYYKKHFQEIRDKYKIKKT